jgi:hypothetical protein
MRAGVFSEGCAISFIFSTSYNKLHLSLFLKMLVKYAIILSTKKQRDMVRSLSPVQARDRGAKPARRRWHTGTLPIPVKNWAIGTACMLLRDVPSYVKRIIS